MNAPESQKDFPPPADAGPSRGYQWKSLFLPHGTELRMTTSRQSGYARVVGDKIMFDGFSVSPRGLTLAIAGEGRNAWRDLWIKFPQDRHWRSASFYREQAKARAEMSAPALSPAESMHMAAAAMAQALDTALLLVKQSCTPHRLQPDRRTDHHRRASDVLGETCAFD